jgi:serine-type D-Ala-D-Ala carboxypeptidase/endopeptidase
MGMLLRIRYWRKVRGWTLKDLSTLTGIAFQTLSQYERGLTDPPSSKLLCLAQALGVEVGDLMPLDPPRLAKHDREPAATPA